MIYLLLLPIYIVLGFLTLFATRTPYDGANMNWATFVLWPVVWLINTVKVSGRVLSGLIEIARE